MSFAAGAKRSQTKSQQRRRNRVLLNRHYSKGGRMLTVVCMGLLASLSVLSSTTSSSRISCLQEEQGNEASDTPWRWGPIASDSSPAARERWVYNNTNCPLELFDEEKFCTKAMECGRKLLLVGDSTVQRWASTVPFLIQATVGKAQCPSGNYCNPSRPNPNSTSRCVAQGHKEQIWNYYACASFCPADNPVQIAYIRHDYLNNVHGYANFHSTICEHWKAVAGNYDYVLVSLGPHIHSMLSHPFGRPVSGSFDEMEFMEQEAQSAAEMLQNVLHPNATLIYRTGPVGLLEYERNCSTRPLSAPPVIHSNYSWDKIPLLNEIYANTLREAFQDRLLVMDTMILNSKMHNCRADHLHFLAGDPVTPVLQKWLILYNILLLQDKTGMNLTVPHRPQYAAPLPPPSSPQKPPRANYPTKKYPRRKPVPEKRPSLATRTSSWWSWLFGGEL